MYTFIFTLLIIRSLFLTFSHYSSNRKSQYFSAQSLSRANISIYYNQVVVEDLYFVWFSARLPLIRLSLDSYQSSQRQLQRQLPRSIIFDQVPNLLKLSEEVIQSENPRR
ncbi:Hypothetical_protein [Hexamita inflata]|uniref:Hypothetical_protein n=1 Tax=Hexamita inflata TaxID=28002 RepID=A0AA86UZD8_9EUKA|nr:Hypothetical protein HINF_LOCUS65925 [Hexamita inflata]